VLSGGVFQLEAVGPRFSESKAPFQGGTQTAARHEN
jgi:hypothetical protein